MNISSNVNEVVRAVLNSLFIFFFYEKILHAPKAPKSPKKHKDATKQNHETLQANSKGMVVPPHQKWYFHTYDQKIVSWDLLKNIFLNKEV